MITEDFLADSSTQSRVMKSLEGLRILLLSRKLVREDWNTLEF
jgi:hypothetical protein